MIPQNTLDSINRYVNDRIPTGGFLTAVLSNDLSGAIGRADAENREALIDIVCHLQWNVRGDCWGSPKKVLAWLNGDES